MNQFNILLQTHPCTYFSSASNPTITSKNYYHFSFIEQREFMLNIFIRLFTYLTIYLMVQLILIYMLQQSRRLPYYTYISLLTFDQRKRIYNTDNKSNSKSCHQRLLLASGNNYSTTLKNNATTITSQNSNYLKRRALTEKSSPAALINGLALAFHHLPSSSTKSQPDNINGNYYQSIIDSLTASTTTLCLYQPLSTKNDNNNYYSEKTSTVQLPERWPPRKDTMIDDVVERTLSNKLIKLWKQHEISMEKYTASFQGRPSLRRSRHQYRRYYDRKCGKANDATPFVLSKEQPKAQASSLLQQRQQQEPPLSPLFNDYKDNNSLLSSSASSRNIVNSHSNYDDSHNRHKLYTLAREVLLYYEKEYGSQRGGTPEARRILFLRQAISNFASTN